jgi:isopenicillin-N epimerase
MNIYRRDFFITAGMAALGGIFGACRDNYSSLVTMVDEDFSDNLKTENWKDIRSHFDLEKKHIHMAGLLISSHPVPVRKAIQDFRRSLNKNPARYLIDNNSDLTAKVRNAAAVYMGVQPSEIVITGSTTMGTALAINGLRIRKNQEMLTADYDYYSTHEAILLQSARSGASFRKVPVYKSIHSVTEDEITDSLIKEVRPNTRLVTATWVHSSTGLKVPVKKIGARLDEINAMRKDEDRIIFFVDGVHGFGVENLAVAEMGCDFFTAGTHKWMFGPRGTGVLWGNPRAHNDISPLIPTFTREAGWGGTMTPGGFKPFEHEWGIKEAFDYHLKIGKQRIQDRIHSLASQLKEGLKSIQHVTLYTPIDENLSAGIVCFDVDGMTPVDVVRALLDKNIVASVTPYHVSYARLTPCIFNTPEEVEKVLNAIKKLK